MRSAKRVWKYGSLIAALLLSAAVRTDKDARPGRVSVEQRPGERRDERGAGDGEDPGPDDPAGDAPAHGRSVLHRAYPDDRARDRVGGRHGDAEVSCQEEGD